VDALFQRPFPLGIARGVCGADDSTWCRFGGRGHPPVRQRALSIVYFGFVDETVARS